jgi:hypothetical protein
MAADGAVADFIVREQAQPGAAFDILCRGYIGDMHARVTALAERVAELGFRSLGVSAEPARAGPTRVSRR